MFCKKCGNQMKETQRFCTQCGNESSQSQGLFCEGCGHQIEGEGAFCNACGAPVTIANSPKEKSFCPYCGERFGADERFCKQCGHAKMIQTNFTDGIRRIFRKDKDDAKCVGGDSLFFKYYIAMAAMFALVIVFWFVPAFKLELPVLSFVKTDADGIYLSMGAPFSDDILEKMLEEEVGDGIVLLKLLSGIFTFLLNVVPLGICVLLFVVPLVKKTYTQSRLFVFQKIVSIYCVVTLIFNRIIWGAIISQATEQYTAKVITFGFSFGGVVLLLILLGVTALQFWVSYQSKKRLSVEEK